MATRITVLVESVNDTGATATGRASAEVKGYANQQRIILTGSKVFKAAIESHRKARRDQRVRHGARV